MSNVGVFVDLALAALLLIALVMGWRQGFVQALTRILVVVAALRDSSPPGARRRKSGNSWTTTAST